MATPHIPRRAVAAVVFWDFDGTVYRAPAGCRRYGEEIARSLDATRADEYLARLDRYLAGRGGATAADGWEAAVQLADEYGAGAGGTGAPSWHEEFRRAREYLEGGDCPIEVPAGFGEALARLRPISRHVLLSNTPSFGVFGLLGRLGISELFDEVICEGAKPLLLPARLAAAANVYGRPVSAVLSVGDHFANDVAPALEAGAAGAYVNSYGACPVGAGSFEARTMEELLPAIERWVRDAQDS